MKDDMNMQSTNSNSAVNVQYIKENNSTTELVYVSALRDGYI